MVFCESDAQFMRLVEVLQLIRSENVGPITFFNLLKLYKTPQKALDNIANLAYTGGKKKIKIASKEEVIDEIRKIREYGAKILPYYDENYPQYLKNIYDPPPAIIVKGQVDLLKRKSIAVVGSRNATVNGCRIAYKLSKELGENGYICVSGLAKGIDTSVHKASLQSGTVAVIAGGINQIYPPENKDLQEEIAISGLIITEFPYDMIPVSQNFPRRNRIISGLSTGTLVIEASLKSGSLITAKYALEQGRDVFAIPGFPMDPRCQGTNSLIKNGAYLVESIDDIINNLNDFEKSNKPVLENSEHIHYYAETENITSAMLEEARKILMEKISYNPVSLDDILNYASINYNCLLTVILELELSGRLQRHPGNKISLIYGV